MYTMFYTCTGLVLALLMLNACGPTREDSWNSYYYGTDRGSIAGIDYKGNDNDDAYTMPAGSWEDNQMPLTMPSW